MSRRLFTAFVERTDWPRLERRLAAYGVVFLTGSTLYFLYIVIDALVAGRFQAVAR